MQNQPCSLQAITQNRYSERNDLTFLPMAAYMYFGNPLRTQNESKAEAIGLSLTGHQCHSLRLK